MHANNNSRNQQSYWPRAGREQHGVQAAFPTSHSRPGFNYPSQSTYTQRGGQHYRGQYNQNPSSAIKVGYENDNMASQPNWVNNVFQSQHHNSFYQKAIYNPQFGGYGGNTMNQLQTLPFGGQQPFHQSNVPCLTMETIGSRGNFPPNNVSTYLTQMPSQTDSQMSINQEDTDKMWLKQWLEQNHMQTTNDNKPKKTLKISEAQNLFQRYLSLNNQLKEQHDELHTNVDSDPETWNSLMAQADKIKEEMVSIQNILNDSDMIRDLEEKIHKRKKKRLRLKNRQKRRYLEKQEDNERRIVLHEKIDLWQKEIREKDLAARKAASLKHEAGGVLGEVRRKLQDCQKLQELIKSLVKLRELRKSEGEKKGVYPKTSSSEDSNFTTRCEQVDKMVEERIKTYEEEEKALRVIIMEEEDEREKKEKQQRLEQKALLNLSKEADPLAEFRRYYEQADESIQYLIQIRREWDIYLTPDVTLGSRVPDEDVTAGPPTSSLWASVLEDGDQQVKNVE